MKSWHELFCSYESAKYLMEQAFIFDQEDILTIDLICGLEGSREAVQCGGTMRYQKTQE